MMQSGRAVATPSWTRPPVDQPGAVALPGGVWTARGGQWLWHRRSRRALYHRQPLRRATMSDAVNGEARTGVAVLCSRVDRIDREMTDNDEAHKAIYARIERLEIAIAQLQTRVAMWAAIGAALAGIAVQVAFKVW